MRKQSTLSHPQWFHRETKSILVWCLGIGCGWTLWQMVKLHDSSKKNSTGSAAVDEIQACVSHAQNSLSPADAIQHTQEALRLIQNVNLRDRHVYAFEFSIAAQYQKNPADLNQAITFYRRALASVRRHATEDNLKDRDVTVMIIHTRLAECYEAQEKFEEATKQHRQAYKQFHRHVRSSLTLRETQKIVECIGMLYNYSLFCQEQKQSSLSQSLEQEMRSLVNQYPTVLSDTQVQWLRELR